MIESFVFSKTIEGFEFKPDAIPGTRDFSNNIVGLQEKSNQLNDKDKMINNNYMPITNGITDLSNNYNATYNNPKYNTIDLPDKTDLVKTTTDLRKEDLNTLILQQNYIYIVGSITCATLLIAAIIIGKE